MGTPGNYSTPPVDEEDFVSMYDVLGRAGGTVLGKKLHLFAKAIGSRQKTREVNTIEYKGKVMIYPKSTVEAFFRANPL